MVTDTLRPLLHSVMEKAADNLIPFQATLEVTHRCNLSCQHCYIDTPEQDELSLDEFKDTLNQLAEAGCLYLLFTGGEPLTRRDFFDIAFYARERGFISMFLTNGTLITPEIARDIAELKPLFVGMSLHGASPETHDSITRRQGSFVAVMNAIQLLRERAVAVYLQTLLMESNIHEAKQMRNLAQRLGVPLRFNHELIPTRGGSLAPYRYRAGSDELSLFLHKELTGKSPVRAYNNGICKAGRGICSISPTGDVFPCLLMPLKVGNVRLARFSEIWRIHPCPELSYLRSITWDDLISCQGCNLAKYCRRCMGIAFAETGELTRPAPSACRNAVFKSKLST